MLRILLGNGKKRFCFLLSHYKIFLIHKTKGMINMKKITINENNLKYEEMTKEVKRAKAIIINDDAQALLMH